jgi:hypothetical protein
MSLEVLKQIDRLFEEFKDEVHNLINNLQVAKGNLRFLAMKLDFNSYYSGRDIEKQNRFINPGDNGDEEDYQDEDDGDEGGYIPRNNIAENNYYNNIVSSSVIDYSPVHGMDSDKNVRFVEGNVKTVYNNVLSMSGDTSRDNIYRPVDYDAEYEARVKKN